MSGLKLSARHTNPKNRWANQYEELSNQSNFHETVRYLFQTDQFFSNLSCYQEVPVHELIEDYSSHQHRYDWYIEELNTIVELHGEQHYNPTAFGHASFEAVQKAFQSSQKRDLLKKEAAEAAGFRYVCISYKEIKKITGAYLKTLLLENQ